MYNCEDLRMYRIMIGRTMTDGILTILEIMTGGILMR